MKKPKYHALLYEIVKHFMRKPHSSDKDIEKRRREVLELQAQHLSIDEIAQQLNTSRPTIYRDAKALELEAIKASDNFTNITIIKHRQILTGFELQLRECWRQYQTITTTEEGNESEAHTARQDWMKLISETQRNMQDSLGIGLQIQRLRLHELEQRQEEIQGRMIELTKQQDSEVYQGQGGETTGGEGDQNGQQQRRQAIDIIDESAIV